MTQQSSNLAQAAEQIAHESNARIKIVVGVLGTAIVILGVVLTTVLIQIQASRFALCVDQNHRHDATIAYIERVARQDERHASKAKRTALRVAVAQDEVLIQDLAPHQNCAVKTQ